MKTTSTGGWDADWHERIPQNQALSVISLGEHVGDGCHVKDCFWRGYRYNGKTYIGLNDTSNLWEVDEPIMLAHCTED